MAKKKSKKPVALNIEWNVSDDIITRFATNFVIQNIGNEFKILFFEVKPAIVLTEEDMAKIQEKGTVRADCIGSFIITADRLPQFVDILNQHLSKHRKRQQEAKESSSPSST